MTPESRQVDAAQPPHACGVGHDRRPCLSAQHAWRNPGIDSEGRDHLEYTRLGNAGLKVSRLGLGCMSYGDPTTPNAHPWSLTEEEARPFFRQAVDLGVTFWDTANVYQL